MNGMKSLALLLTASLAATTTIQGQTDSAQTLQNHWIDSIPDQTYTGLPIRPAISVRDNSRTLTAGIDYTLVGYSNNTNPGTATVSISGIGAYRGVASAHFRILPIPDATGFQITFPSQTYTYSGQPICPVVSVRNVNGEPLFRDIDYTLAFSNNINAGEAFVIITGKGNYAGVTSVTFRILPKQLDTNHVGIIDGNFVFRGDSIKPLLSVNDNEQTLALNTDYALAYSHCIDAGTAIVHVTGIGNYDFYAERTFTIHPAALLNISIDEQIYAAEPILPQTIRDAAGQLLYNNKDFIITDCNNNLNVGTASISISAIANYSGTKSASFNILPKPLTQDMAQLDDNLFYTGQPLQPSLSLTHGTLTLTDNRDYRITAWNNNTNAGNNASLTVVGLNNFTGTLQLHFNILPITLQHSFIQYIPDQPYNNGLPITPTPTVNDGLRTLIQNTDYLIDHYTNNSQPGIASITITGINNYTGTATLYFNIIHTTDAPAPNNTPAIRSLNNLILISNLTPNQPLTIHNLQGQTLLRATPTASQLLLPFPQRHTPLLLRTPSHSLPFLH